MKNLKTEFLEELSKKLIEIRADKEAEETDLYDLIIKYQDHESGYGPESFPQVLDEFEEHKETCEYVSQWAKMVGPEMWNYIPKDGNFDVDDSGKSKSIK